MQESPADGENTQVLLNPEETVHKEPPRGRGIVLDCKDDCILKVKLLEKVLSTMPFILKVSPLPCRS
jgi:hypothetical protein